MEQVRTIGLIQARDREKEGREVQEGEGSGGGARWNKAEEGGEERERERGERERERGVRRRKRRGGRLVKRERQVERREGPSANETPAR